MMDVANTGILGGENSENITQNSINSIKTYADYNFGQEFAQKLSTNSKGCSKVILRKYFSS